MAFSMSTISALLALSSSTMAFARDHTFLAALAAPHEVSLKENVMRKFSPDANFLELATFAIEGRLSPGNKLHFIPDDAGESSLSNVVTYIVNREKDRNFKESHEKDGYISHSNTRATKIQTKE